MAREGALPLLHQPVLECDASRTERPAVVWTSGSLTHGELRATTLRIAARLGAAGIGRGHRVAICLPKCAESVQAILGTLAAGATYVPVDALAPPARIRQIVSDAQTSLLLTTEAIHGKLLADGPLDALGPVEVVRGTGTGQGLDAWIGDAAAAEPPAAALDDDAVILYTSGSTGRPKGVVLSHRNVSSFAQWTIRTFGLEADDRFTSHAPFHFDLSTLDLFASLGVGASVFLLDARTTKFPTAVAKLVADQRITVWYSVPTALRHLSEYGGLEKRDLSSLRLVFFAGEVFPLPGLRKLMRQLPHARYVNMYGPTETNVCTYHVLPGVPGDEETAIPIGRPCEHLDVTIRGEDGATLGEGEVGEICVAGPGVSRGYWRHPGQTRATRVDGRPDSYRTGDFGSRHEHGEIRFAGRRDHQIKIRGHRVELNEIESRLVTHEQVDQAAVVLLAPEAVDARLVAFVASAGDEPPTGDSLHRHCVRLLPSYALPAQFLVRRDLPATSTGKVDRQRLAQLARETLESTAEESNP